MTEPNNSNVPLQAALIQEEILEILKDAKVLARRFYCLTGKPLGVTGEVAEYEAATRSACYYILQGRQVTTLQRRWKMASRESRSRGDVS